MSESGSADDYGSAKDDNFKESGNSAAESDSDEEPLAKKPNLKKKSTKSPKKKLKKEKKGKKKAGQAKKVEKPAKTSKVSFSLDPLAGASPPEKEDDEDEEEEEYEVKLIMSSLERELKFVLRSKRSLDIANTTASSFIRFAGRDMTQFTTPGSLMNHFPARIFSKSTTQR